MNYRGTYELTYVLQRKAIRQNEMRGIPGLLLLFVGLLGFLWFRAWLLNDAETFATLPEVMGIAAAIFAGVVFFAYWRQVSRGLRIFDSIGASEHEVLISDESIQLISAAYTRTVRWEQVGKIREMKDFLMLVGNHRVALLNIPKEALTPEAIAFVKAKVYGS